MAVTPEQVVEAVERLGSFRAAADETGVSRDTVARWFKASGKPQPLEKGQRRKAAA